MTRAYVDMSAYEQALVSLTSQMGDSCSWDFERDYVPLRNDPVVRAVCAGIRWAAPDITQFHKLFSCALEESLDITRITFTGVITLGPTPDTLRVFPNITLNYVELEHALEHTGVDLLGALQSMTPFSFAREGLKDFLHNYAYERNDPNKATAWTTLRRSLQRLRKSEVMSITRALARYTTIGDIYGSGVMRDVALQIECLRKPLELCFADKPEDFVTMYAGGPSTCMVQGGAAASSGWAWMLNLGVHPTFFFAYHPYVRGVYITRGGGVCARTFIYEQENGDWQYGRVYPNDAMGKKLKALLKAQGYTELPRIHGRTAPSGALLGDYERACTFKVPGVRKPSTDMYYCPLPYFDNMYNSILLKFDEDTKEFDVTLGCSGVDPGNAQLMSLAGAISNTDLTLRHCLHCLRKIKADGDVLVSQHNSSIWFCCTTCMLHSGYCQAFRSDGEWVVIPQSEALRDALSHNYWYTNVEAAKASGARMVAQSVRQEPEESEEYTRRCGYFIELGGDQYAIESEDVAYKIQRTVPMMALSSGYNAMRDPEKRCHLTGNVIIKKQRVVEFDSARPIVIFSRDFVAPQIKPVEFELDTRVAVLTDAVQDRRFSIRVQEAA